MKFGSLFSGIGGFDLGFERAGMECAWQCEIDPKASEVLKHHWPEVKNYSDVKTITKQNTERVDVICGGFPCQDLSIAGKRAGLTGSRSGLWFEFARIIDELEPKWVVIENVPGLLSSNNGADFAVILRWLVERGYGVCWRVLDSQYFGVAQRRRRVFVVASFGSGRSAEVLFESEGMCWDTPTRGEAGERVTYAITHGPGSGYRLSAEDNFVTCWEMQHASEAYRESGDIAHNLQARMGTGGNNVPYVGVRRLTPTECARLQGFPDDWNSFQADSSRYKQYGNAVTVNVAEWIGKRIKETA